MCGPVARMWALDSTNAAASRVVPTATDKLQEAVAGSATQPERLFGSGISAC